MRTFVTGLATTGLLVSLTGSLFREGGLIVTGLALLACALVTIGQGEVRP
ncbi:hypothetical protein [Actinoplanes sp. G11-F43]